METKDLDHQVFMSADRCLASGPSGYVFAIDETKIMKVMLETEPEYLGDEARERLQLEKSIYERLGKHDRICEFKYAVDRGHVVQRLNQNLAERLDICVGVGGPPDIQQGLKWSIQTAEACAYIHGKGVIKSNLNCRNLYMDNQENIKLCDFTASSIDGSVPRDKCDAGFGRPGTDANRPDVQDNLFALGSIMYQISTGREPSWNSSRSAAHHFEELSTLTLAAVITKCWLGQYRSATEVVTELKAIQGTEIHLPKQIAKSHITGTDNQEIC
ncbi:hypothetical protein RBB50_005590 [Rhinocladiella similis]